MSAVLDDGSIVETLVSRPERIVSLIRFHGGNSEIGQTLTVPHLGLIRPYSPDNTLLVHGVVQFPSACGTYRTESELASSIRQFIHRYADLSEASKKLPRTMSCLPGSSMRSMNSRTCGSRATSAVARRAAFRRLAHSATSRCLRAGASTVSPLFRIIDAFRGTLVMDESDFRFSDERTEIVKILNNGNAKGFPVLAKRSHAREGVQPEGL